MTMLPTPPRNIGDIVRSPWEPDAYWVVVLVERKGKWVIGLEKKLVLGEQGVIPP